MKITKKWHNKYGARIVNAKYFKHIDIDSLLPGLERGSNGTKSTDLNVSTNRTHKKTENAANDKESDSIGESP